MFNFISVFYDLYVATFPGGWRLRQWISCMAKPIVPKNIYASAKRLNLGSSNRLLPGYVNADLLPEHKPDVICSVDKLDFAQDGAYDLVRASHVLEHFTVADCKRVIEEWKRVIRPGGYLVVCCPDYIRLSWRAILCPQGFDSLSDRFMPGWMNGLYALDLPPALGHKSVFTERSLCHLLQNAGFRVLGRQRYQVEEPYILGIDDNSNNIYSVNLVAQKIT